MADQIKVLITDGMAEGGQEILRSAGNFDLDVRKGVSAEKVKSLIGNYDCIIIRSATKLTTDIISEAKNMKLIVRAGAGVDNIDVEKATEMKIPVMNTASANSNAAAEQTIALMFSLLRQIPQSYVTLQNGKWERASFKGYEAEGKTLGVIGLGNIGSMVAAKGVGLGMKIAGFDPVAKSLSQIPRLANMEESVSLLPSMNDVIAKADILTIHVPKVKETANLINSESLANMKDGAFLINCARGGIVDEAAVIKAVDDGKLAGAAFDVFSSEPPEFPNPLFTHPKIVCVPHLGASTFEAQTRVADTAGKQMIGFFNNNEKIGVINNV